MNDEELKNLSDVAEQVINIKCKIIESDPGDKILTYGDKLKILIKKAGFTDVEFAKMLHIPICKIVDFEYNKEFPSRDELILMRKILMHYTNIDINLASYELLCD